MTRLEQLLGTVKRCERELTIDADDLTAAQRAFVIAAAKARGLDVAGTRRWLLIRAL